MITKEFILAGRAIFTLQVPPTYRGPQDSIVRGHYTYRVRHKAADTDHKEAWFVQLLTGPDNSNDYTYLGMLYPGVIDDKSVTFQLTSASKHNDKSVPVILLRQLLKRVWAGEQHLIEEAGFKLHHEGKCARCGKKLTTPESVTAGFGKECLEILQGVR